MIEVWFFKTPYKDLIRMRDWKGVLLKAHINWLNQNLTHCVLRVNLGVDVVYQATWNGLLAFKTETLIVKPAIVLDVTHCVDSIKVIEELQNMFLFADTARVTLDNLLHLMYRKPHKVNGILCTSLVLNALGVDYIPMDLYPDYCYNLLKRYASKGKTRMS